MTPKVIYKVKFIMIANETILKNLAICSATPTDSLPSVKKASLLLVKGHLFGSPSDVKGEDKCSKKK